jgi:hypothetical protein
MKQLLYDAVILNSHPAHIHSQLDQKFPQKSRALRAQSSSVISQVLIVLITVLIVLHRGYWRKWKSGRAAKI